jgi:hypothetical protein
MDGKVAWCEAPCNTLRISRAGEPDVVFVAVGHRYTMAEFSPDGRRLATVRELAVETGSSSTTEIAIVDGASGAAVAGFTSTSDVDVLAWAPTSDAVIATTDAPDSSETTISYYALSGAVTTSTIPIGNVQRMTAISTTVIPHLSTARFTRAEDCTAAHIHSTDRATPCSYGYP